MKQLMMIGFVVFLAACNGGKQQEEINNSEVTFFDMKAFFEKEANNFEYKSLKKTATLNGKVETKTISDFDIKEELSMFSKSNINRPAWKDKYKVTETPNKITYKAADEELNIKSVVVEKKEGTVSKITIISSSENSLLETNRTMIYEPNKGFLIDKSQSVALGGKDSMKIKVEFL